MNPNHHVAWLKTRPEFSITYLRGTSTSRGYHESFYEIVSERELSIEDIGRLDDCNLLGMGQGLHMQKQETFEEEVPPVVVDRRTGEVVECDCFRSSGHPDHQEACASIPRSYDGTQITNTHSYLWHRYTMLRVCDSGD